MQTVRIVADPNGLWREVVDVSRSAIVARQPWDRRISLPTTIVIRCRNEARMLGQVFDGIAGQLGGGQVDVIVVDDSSTDETVTIAHSRGARVIDLPPNSFSYGGALNVGVQAASGQVCVFLSGHSVPSSRLWLANLTLPLSVDPGLAGVFGREVNFADATPTDVWFKLLATASRETYFYLGSGVGFINSNSAVRRSLALAVPFNEKIGAGEDTVWAAQVIRQGWRVLHTPDAPTLHSHYLDWPGMVKVIGDVWNGALLAR